MIPKSFPRNWAGISVIWKVYESVPLDVQYRMYMYMRIFLNTDFWVYGYKVLLTFWCSLILQPNSINYFYENTCDSSKSIQLKCGNEKSLLAQEKVWTKRNKESCINSSRIKRCEWGVSKSLVCTWGCVCVNLCVCMYVCLCLCVSL